MTAFALVAALSAPHLAAPTPRLTPSVAVPLRGCPEIATHPGDLTARSRRAIELSVVATGDELTYQWRKGGENLEDGGRISGSTTATLAINDSRWEDAGVYDVIVTSGGCSIDSNDASVGVLCYPSCTCYGYGPLSLSDFGCFQTKFALGDPYADCNLDGVLTLSDFGCFMSEFALGCQ
jgi:hypothetical protein